MLPHSGETEFVSSNQKSRFSKSHENTGLVLERCHTWECDPKVIFDSVNIPSCTLYVLSCTADVLFTHKYSHLT